MYERDEIGSFASPVPESADLVQAREEPAERSRLEATQMRTSTESGGFWGRRLAAGAVLAVVLGMLVGGTTSAYFFIAAVVIGLGAAWMYRVTMPPGTDGGAGP